MVKTSLEKHKIKILLLEGIHQSAVERFNVAGYKNVEYHQGTFSESELIEKIGEYHFLCIRSRTNVTAKVLGAAQKLVAIGCCCIGTNQVDAECALLRGIPVFNAPYSNTRSVAELVLAEMILLMRRIPERNASLHRGEWNKSAQKSHEVRGKKLGIVGYGSIGSQLSILAEAIGMRVFFYDISRKLPMGNSIQIVSLEKLLKTCDVISLHVPETEFTQGMLGEKELALMPKESVLINASRGSVVDIDALTTSLKSDHLKGAAIDVYPEEPKSNRETFESPLREIDSVILTPHIGGSTIEAQHRIGEEVAEKLVKYSDNGSTLSAVNFPEVSLPSHPDKHRLLHIHENIPGVLSQINSVFSENQINIAAQYLQTLNEVGYVVVDVDKSYSLLALQKLQKIAGTIRTRVLF
jgi:D-3-phosphoglycerate dehydrogenase